MTVLLERNEPDPQQVIADLQRRLAERTAERDEGLARETAVAEVLGVINASPGDLAPVFDAMLAKAFELCDGVQGSLWTFHAGRPRLATARNLSAEFIEVLREQWERAVPSEHHPMSRVLRGELVVQILDIAASDFYRAGDPAAVAAVELGSVRTVMFVALVKDSAPVGVFIVARREVRPFADRQIALLQNFAAQAVIAMENARLITETREALEQQTATAEVLGVINGSLTDTQPVFDAIVQSGLKLFPNALIAVILPADGQVHAVAVAEPDPARAEAWRRRFPVPLHREYMHSAAIADRKVIDISDVEHARTEFAVGSRTFLASGYRAITIVPMLRRDAAIGALSVVRHAPGPLSAEQVGVLKTFANQAVIAIENARLLGDLRERTADLQEALEYQTATSDLLKLISRSTFDLDPVLGTLVERAVRLCGADSGHLTLPEGEDYRTATAFAMTPELEAITRDNSFAPGRGTAIGRALTDRRVVQIEDIGADPEHAIHQAAVRGLVRTVLAVPLLREGEPIGALGLARSRVEPFTDRQIELVRTFADQAVIAIENTRLITETREALQQQTATAEVLQVINASPGNLTPVFDAILEKAHTLCGAVYGALGTYDGEHYFRAVAMRGYPKVLAERLREGFDGSRNPVTIPLIEGAAFVHIPNLAEIDHPIPRAVAELGELRTGLFLALRKDGVLLGHLSVTRPEVRPFAEKEIALLENFAAQAVIAMENARLITETREALEQQTATAEVLQVINASPGNLAPVFDAILDKAMRLCGASFGELRTYDGERFLLAAAHGTPTAYVEYYRKHDTGRYGPGTGPARLLAGERVVHIPDLIATEPYQRGDPDRRAIVDIAGARAYVLVPLLLDETVRGFILVYREEARPFSEKQIGVLQSFAAQAVIAMDNARLLNEIRQRQAELRVTFDNMGDGVAMFDADLRLAAWNVNFQRILDVPDQLIAGRPSSTELIRYLAQHGEFGAVDVEAEVQRISDSMGQQWSTERIRPDERVIEVRNNPVPGGGFVLIYSDVTERKRAEEEIRTARDAAEKALAELRTAQASLIHAEKMASLGQLTAGIAHEIKNPLNFVNNFAGLSIELLDELKETAAPGFATLDDNTRADVDETVVMLTGNLEKIAEHGKRADDIVKSMLEHSRGASGERRAVDLNALVDEALNLAFHGARAQDQGFNITMERHHAADLSPIEVAPQELTRVFLNLFGNGFYAANKRSREAADGFRPTLTVTTHDFGEAVEIKVRDNGIGIPAENRDKLFQPFFTTKPTGEGTGLGLSISYDIITQQHGGTIGVASEPGAFTEFTVRLPRQ